MKAVLGIVLILIGLFLGFYVGGYLMFVKGIIQVIEGVTAEVLIASDVAWGLLKIVCASFIGVLSAVFPLTIGYTLITD